MSEKRQVVKTLTGEIFFPVRLYYKVQSKVSVEVAFKKIRCMDFDLTGDRWTWLYDDEAKKLKFEQPYSAIPPHRRPIILGSFYSRVDDQMYLDVGSIERALKAIEFFDKRIKRAVAELEYFAVYNKITASESEHPGACFDKLFSGVRTSEIDSRREEYLARITEAMKSGRAMEVLNRRDFELVEAFRINYYTEG